MEVSFVIALYHLNITANLGKGDKLDDNTYISNDSSIAKSLVPGYAINVIGMLEYEAIKNAKAFVYSVEQLPEGMTPQSYLIDRLHFVQAFLSIFWLQKENNVCFERGFIFYREGFSAAVDSNFLSAAPTTSDGKEKLMTLSRDQLQDARTLHRNNLNYSSNSYEERKETALLKNSSRFERAFFHIQVARHEVDIRLKITSYCSALEALFSSSQAELAHQLSERLAHFISDSPEERLATYKQSKKAYTTRSKIVHGTTVREVDLPQIVDSSTFCDNSLRVVMSELLRDETKYNKFLENNSLFDEYMINLIFGISD